MKKRPQVAPVAVSITPSLSMSRALSVTWSFHQGAREPATPAVMQKPNTDMNTAFVTSTLGPMTILFIGISIMLLMIAGAILYVKASVRAEEAKLTASLTERHSLEHDGPAVADKDLERWRLNAAVSAWHEEAEWATPPRLTPLDEEALRQLDAIEDWDKFYDPESRVLSWTTVNA